MRKANYYSKLFMGTAIVVIFAMVVIVLAFAFAPLKQTIAEVDENDSIEDFIDAFSVPGDIEATKTLTDFAGNEFLLYEIDSEAYTIYSIGETQRFIEGSDRGYSPIHNYLSEEIYYLGPFTYLVKDGDELVDVLDGTAYAYSDMAGATYDYEQVVDRYKENVVDEPAISPMSYYDSGYTYVDNAQYFENIISYPPNTNNSCGLTALSILLGYYDTYVNDGFLADQYIVKDTTKTTSRLDDIPSIEIAPGVNYAFGELLFNEYMHYNEELAYVLEGLGYGISYPMANFELRDTMKDYLENETTLANSVEHLQGSIIQTHANPRSYIVQDMPTILVLSDYNYQTDDGEWHTVVAYGFNSQTDTFIANYGWGSYRNRVILDEYTCYAYYALDASAVPHVHSKNATVRHNILGLESLYALYDLCGCGEYTLVE